MKKIILIVSLMLITVSCIGDSIGKRIQVIKTQRIERVKFNSEFDNGLIKLEKLTKEQPEKYKALLDRAFQVKNSTLALETLIQSIIDVSKEKGVRISEVKNLESKILTNLLNPKVLNMIKDGVDQIYINDKQQLKEYRNIEAFIKLNFNFNNYTNKNGGKSNYYETLAKGNSIQILGDLEYILYSCSKYKNIAIKTFTSNKRKL